MEEKVSGALPVLLMVTARAVDAAPTDSLTKLSEVVLSFATGAGTAGAAGAYKITDCCEPASSSTIERVACIIPAIMGLKVTNIAQLLPAGKEPGHAFATAKLFACPPMIDTDDMLSGLVRLL